MWVLIVGLHVDEHCGMRNLETFINAFAHKRILAEYGRFGEEATRPNLTIDGKLTVADVTRSLSEPCAYISYVTLMLFMARPDYNVVMYELKSAIEQHVEVYPLDW